MQTYHVWFFVWLELHTRVFQKKLKRKNDIICVIFFHLQRHDPEPGPPNGHGCHQYPLPLPPLLTLQCPKPQCLHILSQSSFLLQPRPLSPATWGYKTALSPLASPKSTPLDLVILASSSTYSDSETHTQQNETESPPKEPNREQPSPIITWHEATWTHPQPTPSHSHGCNWMLS